MFVILNISDSDKHFKSAQEEYLKRLGKKISIDSIRPRKNGSKTQIIQKETEDIISKIKKKYSDCDVIMMSIEGQILNTKQFVDLVWKNTKKKVFLIGGPYGMDEDKLKQEFPNIQKVSFGKMTMPHPLAKLVLLEQIYRITCINTWKKYHY